MALTSAITNQVARAATKQVTGLIKGGLKAALGAGSGSGSDAYFFEMTSTYLTHRGATGHKSDQRPVFRQKHML